MVWLVTVVQSFGYDVSLILRDIFYLKMGCANGVLYLVYSIY